MNEALGIGIKVLVVDDSDIGREVIRQDLKSAGFDIETASSGREAIEKVKSFHPEVILLDIEMPEMNGLETCALLKADQDTALSQVVFLTGHDADDALVVQALEVGGNDFISKSYSRPILHARVRNQSGIYRAKAQLQKMVMTDELTGVFNRRFLFDSLRRNIKRLSRRKDGLIGCMILDVDHFKSINDRFGHLEGDRVLKQVARTIRASVRESDLVARYGGEEFVVVTMDTDAEGSLYVAEKLRETVEKECVPVTVSIGLAATTVDAERDTRTSEDLELFIHRVLRAADEAVYASKRNGRNRVTDRLLDNEEDADPTDKRTQPRFFIQTEVDIIGKDGELSRHQTADLSMGGLALDGVAEDTAKGDTVYLLLGLGEDAQKVHGRVKWTGQIPGLGLRAGVSFEGLNQSSESALRRFIHDQNEDEEGSR